MRRMMVAIGAAVALTGSTQAAEKNDPAKVQDPPGSVDVNQPADVALEERDTDRDTTDTMHGARTEVIDSKSAPATAREGTQWREVEPGREARASFNEPPASNAEPAAGATTDRMPGTVHSDDTILGTDQGYGTGTEPVETPAR